MRQRCVPYLFNRPEMLGFVRLPSLLSTLTSPDAWSALRH